MILGLDASNWQGRIDWTQVAASGRVFAAAKASEGTAYTDPCFADNWQGMKAAGLVRLAYHFARPSTNTPEQEAAHFLASVESAGGFEPGDMPVLDMEDRDVAADANLLDWTVRWMVAVGEAVGCVPTLYSGAWYMEPHGLTGRTELADHPLWLAAYQAEQPSVPAGWRTLTLWQYSDKETVPGIVGLCDGDRFMGTVEELRALGKPAPLAETQIADLLARYNTIWTVCEQMRGVAPAVADAIEGVIVADKQQRGIAARVV